MSIFFVALLAILKKIEVELDPELVIQLNVNNVKRSDDIGKTSHWRS